MKKQLLILLIIFIFIAGCGNKDKIKEEKQKEIVEEKLMPMIIEKELKSQVSFSELINAEKIVFPVDIIISINDSTSVKFSFGPINDNKISYEKFIINEKEIINNKDVEMKSSLYSRLISLDVIDNKYLLIAEGKYDYYIKSEINVYDLGGNKLGTFNSDADNIKSMYSFNDNSIEYYSCNTDDKKNNKYGYTTYSSTITSNGLSDKKQIKKDYILCYDQKKEL